MNNPLPDNKHYQTFTNEEPAFPVSEKEFAFPGLNKRQHALLELTKAALMGLSASDAKTKMALKMVSDEMSMTETQLVAMMAVQLARATLAELEKEQG